MTGLHGAWKSGELGSPTAVWLSGFGFDSRSSLSKEGCSDDARHSGTPCSTMLSSINVSVELLLFCSDSSHILFCDGVAGQQNFTFTAWQPHRACVLLFDLSNVTFTEEGLAQSANLFDCGWSLLKTREAKLTGREEIGSS